MKSVAEPVKTSRNAPKPAEPAVLGRSPSKDPARDQARRSLRDKDVRPMRSGATGLKLETPEEPTLKRKPSRVSRSMKSRQSEPRGSKAKAKSGPRQKVNPPVLLMGAAAVLVAIGLILLPRAYQPSVRSGEEVRLPSIARSNRTEPQANVVTKTSSSGSIITARARQNQAAAMNLTPVGKINLEQIAGFQAGIPPVILFRDGSKLNADPVTLEQLPADVRLQLTYTRGTQ
jgi:hypothetical protein